MVLIATYNIWFDSQYILERARLIIKEILEQNPIIDVIGFQEVTPITLEYFLKSPLNKSYSFSKTELKQSYDTLLIWKKTLTLNNYYNFKFKNSKMGRGLEVISLQNSLSENYLIGTSHLESEFKTHQVKLNQFNNSFKTLQKYSKNHSLVIFMADTNITDTHNSKFIIPDQWLDTFLVLDPPRNLKWTYDHQMNDNVLVKKKSRLDRIYYFNNGTAIPNSFAFLGQEPNQEGIYPSDHFGVLSSFNII
jgi:hypothetical protein